MQDKKMIFITYCPDDQWTGCSMLSAESELAYRRIQDLIYMTDDKLFNDEIAWQQITRGFSDQLVKVKNELVLKKKIQIDDYIKNKRCSEVIEEAKNNYAKNQERALKGAKARWDKENNATSNANAVLKQCQPLTINHKPLTNNNKSNIYTQEFDIFWRKYVLDEHDKRSTKYDAFKQWKKLKDEEKESLGDKFLTYKRQKGDFYKALERFISKKIYLEITAEKTMTKEEIDNWQFNTDIEMRRKGLKTMRWSMDYIEKLDEYIANNP